MYITTIKNSIRILSQIVAVLIIGNFSLTVGAEGSRQLISKTKYRSFLEYSNTSKIAGLARKTDVFVYAKTGEKIALGSSASNIGPTGSIAYTSPNGVTGVCNKLLGKISNPTQEKNGPFPLKKGYIPCLLPVTAATEGIWQINFLAPDTNSIIDGNKNPRPITAEENWTQPNDVPWVAAWDATVLSITDQEIKGRSYVNYLTLNQGGNAGQKAPTSDYVAPADLSLTAQLYVQTKNGYQFKVNYKNLDAFGFVFASNEKGVTQTSGESTYKSLQLTGKNPNWTLPSGLNYLYNQGKIETNKIFFEAPAADLPQSAKSATGQEWLINGQPKVVKASKITFEKSSTNKGLAKSGYFNFAQVNTPGKYLIRIDVNDNNSYTDKDDAVLFGNLTAGDNKIFWEGAAGDIVTTKAFRADVRVISSEAHFSLTDAENNLGGVTVEKTLPNPVNYDLYYPDTTSANLDYLLKSGPVRSRDGVAIWTNNFGDGKILDSWAFEVNQSLALSL